MVYFLMWYSYLTFKRIFECKEIEELTEKIMNVMFNMYMCTATSNAYQKNP